MLDQRNSIGKSLLVAAVVLLALAAPLGAETKRFKPTAGVQTFAVRQPVLRVKPGDIVETETLYGGYYARAGAEWPGEVGPFYIEGATTNDTLLVKILRLRANRDHAVSNHTPGFLSAIAGDRYTRMLNPPISARRYVWRLEKGGTIGVLDLPESHERLEVRLSPMQTTDAAVTGGGEVFAWARLLRENGGGRPTTSFISYAIGETDLPAVGFRQTNRQKVF